MPRPILIGPAKCGIVIRAMTDPASSPTPDQVRRRARAARRALGPAERARAGSRIREHLLGLEELAHPGRLALSLPTDGEVDVSGLADDLRSRGWVLHLPVIGDGASMVFREWDVDTPLVANRFGIPEPTGSAVSDPGAAGRRAGAVRGRGPPGQPVGIRQGLLRPGPGRVWPGTTCVGVAYAVQVQDAVPHQDWDVVMDVVVTESGVTRPDPG